jgi:hypothetical protein
MWYLVQPKHSHSSHNPDAQKCVLDIILVLPVDLFECTQTEKSEMHEEWSNVKILPHASGLHF